MIPGRPDDIYISSVRLKQTLRFRASRSGFDPRYTSPRWGVVKSLAFYYLRRTGGTGSYARSSVFLKEKTHFRLLTGTTLDRCLVQPVPNGTIRTCWAGGTTSALEGSTDLRWKRRTSGFGPNAGKLPPS